MSDLVKRLRVFAKYSAPSVEPICAEAADRIEALEAESARLKEALENEEARAGRLDAELQSALTVLVRRINGEEDLASAGEWLRANYQVMAHLAGLSTTGERP